MNDDVVLETTDLHKVYPDGTEALRGIDLTFRRGEAVALVGANGSGKSTLMRSLVGLEKISAGDISLHGQDLTTARGARLRRLRRRTAMVFQHINLVDSATVLTNAIHGALGRPGPAVRRWSHALAPASLRQEAMTALERVGLAEFASRRATELSGGQRQRVALARMLMQQPELVLADEPVAALDPSAGRQVMNLLIDIAREQGYTVITTLHQLPLVMDYSDRVVGLIDGEVHIDTPTASTSLEQLGELYGDAASAGEAAADTGHPVAEPALNIPAPLEESELPSKWGIIDPREADPRHTMKKW